VCRFVKKKLGFAKTHHPTFKDYGETDVGVFELDVVVPVAFVLLLVIPISGVVGALLFAAFDVVAGGFAFTASVVTVDVVTGALSTLVALAAGAAGSLAAGVVVVEELVLTTGALVEIVVPLGVVVAVVVCTVVVVSVVFFSSF